MLHNLRIKVRHYWHDLYYYFASDEAIDFAMTCQDATEKIDLKDQAKSNVDKFRVKLHISLCQACNNYYSFTQVLRRAIKKLMPRQNNQSLGIEKLNEDLLKKYSKNKKS